MRRPRMTFQAHPQKRRFRARSRRTNGRLATRRACLRPLLLPHPQPQRPSQARLRAQRLPRTKLRARQPSRTYPLARRPSQVRQRTQQPSRTKRPIRRPLRMALPTRRPSRAQPPMRRPSRAWSPTQAQQPLLAFRSSCRTLHPEEVSRRISCNTYLSPFA